MNGRWGTDGKALWTAVRAAIVAHRGGWMLAVIVLLSLLFRIHIAGECSLWLDEVDTHRAVVKPCTKILRGPVEGHEPLMYVLVRLVTDAVGMSNISLRSVSLLFGCLLLVALYELCRELGLSTARALLVVATFALHPFFIRHATEARFYAILSTFSTLAITRALRLTGERRRFRDLAGFALSVVATAATHYVGLAYALALLGTVGLGLGLGWKQLSWRWRAAVGATLLVCLLPLAKIALRAAAAQSTFAIGEAGAEGASPGIELLRETTREFSFVTSQPWWALLETILALLGLALLTRQLRGAARLLPLGLGAAPWIAATFVTAKHFLAPRYFAPSAVLYHLGACIALFALVERAQRALARTAAGPKLVPYVAAAAIIFPLGLRGLEFPAGFGAGGDDYRSLQRYFESELAKDTAFVAYPGYFGQLIFGREYKLSRQPIGLEKFRAVPDLKRYLIIEIHCDTPERRAELEHLVERYFGLSAHAWRSLPLVPIPHTRYQSAVAARIVEPPADWKPPAVHHRRHHKPKKKHRRHSPDG